MRKVQSVQQATDSLDVFFRIINYIIADIFLTLEYVSTEQVVVFFFPCHNNMVLESKDINIAQISLKAYFGLLSDTMQ